ncbi:hypothetical protein B0I35DRAFT_426335 [Stachybotrys elegans]|uniref:Uncharacterized protein n=1 Tax=Stachybotrys elegans TaxID=80388 RepID=A0A8K0SVP0_9HYPO|nr:hypothetical protein B0I35DRAFT_426335 [Stachybotrys elegans]
MFRFPYHYVLIAFHSFIVLTIKRLSHLNHPTRKMASSDEKDVKQVSAGEKHQTEPDAPSPKRVKTEDEQDAPRDENGADDDRKASSDEKNGEDKKSSNHEDTAEKPGQEPNVPAGILEKGLIYFFIRGRVNINDPLGVQEIARSYLLLRPVSRDAKLGAGPIGDASNARLLALPKKTLPTRGRDRFMVFVEAAGVGFGKLRDEFLASTDYTTKTAGNRHTPAPRPVGEGVYAITTTGRESHLVYMLTLPEQPGDMQREIGLKDRGSFIMSTKNPDYPGPANSQLREGPDFPKKIKEEFRSLRWMPSKPEHLNYANAQVLLIGEPVKDEQDIGAAEYQEGQDTEPFEIIEHLEDEDLDRMKHLATSASAAIYADLEADAKDRPPLKTEKKPDGEAAAAE